MKKYSNTQVDSKPGLVSVTLYRTEIARIENGVLTLNHGGFVTATTARRMNEVLQQAGVKGTVGRNRGDMFYRAGDGGPTIYFGELGTLCISV